MEDLVTIILVDMVIGKRGKMNNKYEPTSLVTSKYTNVTSLQHEINTKATNYYCTGCVCDLHLVIDSKTDGQIRIMSGNAGVFPATTNRWQSTQYF